MRKPVLRRVQELGVVEYENDEIIFQGGGYMAVLVNKTQKNFTMISNSILRDKELSLKASREICF